MACDRIEVHLPQPRPLNHNSRGLQNPQGFTLLETVIAIVILAGSLILLSNSWGAAFMRIRKTQMNFEIAAMLERKMNEIDLQYRGKPLEEIEESKEGDFGSEGNLGQYTWKMSSKKLELPDIAATLTARSGGADQMLMSVIKQMTDALSKAVKEVTVTVIRKDKNQKPVEASVTTYFVDYDKDIQVGMPSGGH